MSAHDELSSHVSDLVEYVLPDSIQRELDTHIEAVRAEGRAESEKELAQLRKELTEVLRQKDWLDRHYPRQIEQSVQLRDELEKAQEQFNELSRETSAVTRERDELRRLAASSSRTAADEQPEFAVRWPDGELTRAADREHGLRAIEIARRVEPGAVLVQRSYTAWREATS